MKKNLLILFVFISGCIQIMGQNAVFVSTTGSDANDGKTWERAFATLEKAVWSVQNNGTIFMSAGTFTKNGYSESIAGSNMPNGINMTIIGGFPAGLTGTSTLGYNPAVNLTNITVNGGLNEKALFMLNVDDGNLAFQGVRFENLDTSGGINSTILTARDVVGKTYSFTDVFFNNNDGVSGAGLIQIDGDTSTNNTINFTNIVATNNLVQLISTDPGTGGNFVNVKNSDFKGNSDPVRGGVFRFDSNATNPNIATIDNNYFCNNKLPLTAIGGGVIASNQSSIRMLNNKFSGNTGTNGNVAFLDETELYATGNVYSYNIANNLATSSNGGAFYLVNAPTFAHKFGQDYDYTFENEKFHHNKSGSVTGRGGAIYVADGIATDINLTTGASNAVEVKNSEFNDNTAVYGGAIATNNASLLVSNSKFIGNDATDGALLGQGGAIYAQDSALSSTSNCYSNNTARESGGAVYYTDNGGAAQFSGFRQFTDGDTYFGNQQTSNLSAGGGALYYTGVRNGIAIRNSAFYNNSALASTAIAGYGGGAINLNGALLAGNDNVTSFISNKFGGNTLNGSTSLANGALGGGSDIKTYYVTVQNITTSTMQLAAQANYPSGDYTFSGTNNFGGATIPVDACTVTDQVDICALTKTTVDIIDEIRGISDAYVVPLGATTSITNILNNDLYQNTAPTISNVTVTFGTPSNSNITVNNATGTITVGPGTPAGDYNVTYTICSIADPTLCSTATVYIRVIPDADGDGVEDAIDIDDDNDGILDTAEGATEMCLNFSTLADGTPTVTNQSLTQGKYTVNYSTTSSETTNLNTVPTGSTSGDLVLGVPNNTSTHTYTITFSKPVVVNIKNKSFATTTSPFLDNGDKWTITSDNGNFTVSDPGVADITVNSNTGNTINFSATTVNPISQTSGDNNFRITSVNPVTSLTFVFSSTTAATNRSPLRICAMVPNDTDGDGIPNYLDLDSDNDGCGDAVEAAAAISPNQLVNAAGTLKGGNSVDPVVATPLLIGTYNQSYLMNLCASSTCVNAQGLPQFTTLPTNYSNTTGQATAIAVTDGTQSIDCTTFCYKPATTGTGTENPTKHGITALSRAGAENGNWPMVRNSAWTALESKSKGFVINRVAFSDADSNPATPDVPTGIPSTDFVEGMMVYDSTNHCLKIYVVDAVTPANSAWRCFSTQACPTVN